MRGTASNVGQNRPPRDQRPPPKRRPRPSDQHIVTRAIGSLSEALMARGFGPADANRFSRLMLSRPGVRIMPNGQVRYWGQRYDAKQFAHSNLAGYVTGRLAERQNRAAILASPVYQSAIATARAQRDVTLADTAATRRRTLLDWGDPALAKGDPLLAAQAAANPFSTQRLIQRQYEQNQLAAHTNANRLGTYGSGGDVSGQQEAARSHAATLTDATGQLTDLLANLSQQEAAARSAVGLARQQGAGDAYNALLQTGGLHATAAPVLTPGRIRIWGRGRRPRGGV